DRSAAAAARQPSDRTGSRRLASDLVRASRVANSHATNPSSLIPDPRIPYPESLIPNPSSRIPIPHRIPNLIPNRRVGFGDSKFGMRDAIRDTGFGDSDSGFGMRDGDSGCGIRGLERF